MAFRSQNWADIEDDDEEIKVPLGPVSTTTGSERREVDYCEVNGQSVKTTKIYRLKRAKRLTNQSIESRRNWTTAMFGKCRDPEF